MKETKGKGRERKGTIKFECKADTQGIVAIYFYILFLLNRHKNVEK